MTVGTTLDPATMFERLRAIQDTLYTKLCDRFELLPCPSDQPLQHYNSPDGQAEGSLQTFAGPELDWLVYAWLRVPERGFSTLRLTAWLGPQVQMPHLVFEFGTVPVPFFYIDYTPRVDLWLQPEYTDRYYAELNQLYLTLREQPQLTLFVSKGLYVRQFQSPAHLCFTGPPAEETLTLIQTTAHQVCDRWLSWLPEAEAVPPDAQAALATRDLQLRRLSAERDPGNAIAAQLFGAELAQQLVRALWDKPSDAAAAG